MNKLTLSITALLFSATSSSAQSNTTDEGVEINGVIWATRNVNAPGTFAENPEDAGMYYQWNSKVGWSATDPMTDSNGGTVWNPNWNGNNSTFWKTENDPCPSGWHVPTSDEMQSLRDADSEWTTVPANGRIISSGDNTIFMPAANTRTCTNGSLTNGGNGYYWGSTTWGGYAYYIAIVSDRIGANYQYPKYGFSVRCVKENNIPTAVNNIPSEKEKTVSGYYSILGEKLPKEPASGLYIILYDD